LSNTLGKEGFEIITNQSGSLSEDLLNEIMPELILLDIDESNKTGFDFCKRVKANDKTKHISMFLISDQNNIRKLLESFKTGISDYILKPFDPAELLLRIKHQIEFSEAKEEINRHNERLESLWRISQFKTNNTKDLLDYALH
jgi:PleD family two-component response regulator